MAATEYEDRKRPFVADGNGESSSPFAAKRPHLDRNISSFQSNGSLTPSRAAAAVDAETDADDLHPAYKGLEAFRKEAIFRKMRQAQREYNRANEKLRQLQIRYDDAQHNASAFAESSLLFIHDLQNLADKGMIPAQHQATLAQVSSDSMPQSIDGFKQRTEVIRQILQSIASGSSSIDSNGLQSRCDQLAEEVSALRIQVDRANKDRIALEQELDLTVEQLRSLERKYDRFHSSTVKKFERPNAEKEEEVARAQNEALEAEQTAALQRKAQADAEIGDAMPSGNVVNGAQHAALVEEAEDARRVAELRSREVEEWMQQVATLRKDNERLQKEVENVPQERLISSDLYRELHRLYQLAGDEQKRLNSLNERLESENNQLREQRQSFETQARTEAASLVEELRTAVKMHEADVARLRGQRDDLTAEVTERKQKETAKYAQIDEIKSLSTTKDARIRSLWTEVHRLQMTLAARSNDENLMQALRTNHAKFSQQETPTDFDAEVSLISTLQSRLRSAEEASTNLQRQLDARSSSTSEQDLATKVSSLQKEVDEMTAVFKQVGSTISLEADQVKALMQQQKTDLEQSKSELTIANTSTTALCDELDKLGAAYNEAQQLAGARIAELGRLEEKVSRLTTEKAKADNKYFSAMRAKDAVENEKRASARNVERQARVIEKYAETEKAWQDQMQKYESEVSSLRRFVREANAKSLELQGLANTHKESVEKLQSAEAAMASQNQQQTDAYLEESRQRFAAQERCEKLQRDLDKTRKQLANAGGARKKGASDDDQVEALNSLLRCSACKDRYRDRVITRCMHTFCHECVDARIATRQRKCPSCGLGFSVSEVQTLFFQ